MALKLPPFYFSKQILKWVSPVSTFSSVSSAVCVESHSHTSQTTPNSTATEAAIRLLKKNLHPERLIAVLDSASDLNSALQIFKWASKQSRSFQTAATYSCMILKLGLAGRTDEMELFVHEMVKAKCPGMDDAYASLIELFCQNGKVVEAFCVFGIMNSVKCRLLVSTCNHLLSTIVNEKGDFQSVVFVYKEMVKAGILPNVDTLNFLIEVLCGTGRIDAALEQFWRMKKKGCNPNNRTFELIIGGIRTYDRIDKLTEILDEMCKVGCVPDSEFCNKFIPLFCKVDRLDEGIRLFSMMTSLNLSPDPSIYGVLIRCFCNNLQLHDAVGLILKMIDTGLVPSADMYVDIVYGFCKLGKFSKAMAFLDEKSVRDIAPYNVLLEGYCRVESFVEAHDFLRKMVQMGVCNKLSWNIMIRGLCENGWIGKALEVLSRMIVHSYIPDDATYSALILGHNKLCKHENALNLFRQVYCNDWYLDSTAYEELIDSLCHAEKIQEATDVFHYMSVKGCNLDICTFNLLLERIWLVGKFEEAIRLRSFAFCCGIYSSSATFTIIMHELCKFNKAKDLLVLLAQMVIEGCALDGKAYCTLIGGLCGNDRIGGAAHLFNHMAGDGFVLDSETLSKLLSCLANHSQVHAVSKNLEKIPSELLSPAMYNLIINSLCREGYKGDACKFLDCMLEKGWVPDAVTHGLLIGNGDIKEIDRLGHDDAIEHDKVSNILAEGLEEPCESMLLK
ncbi:hypothetical protein ACLOJK_002930 [Asimina triloba]